MSVISSYDLINDSGARVNLVRVHPSASLTSAFGQSFKTPASPLYTLDSAECYGFKVGDPTGNIVAVLYAHAGTFGTNSKPTGAALATSDSVPASAFATSVGIVLFSFTGVNRINLSASTSYCLSFQVASATVDDSNYVRLARDTTSPTHEGNDFVYNNNDWLAIGTDCIFYVYGVALISGVSVGTVIPTLLSNLIGDD